MTLLDDVEAPELGAADLAEHDLTRPEREAGGEQQREEVVEDVVLRPTALTIAGALSALAPAFLIARLFRGGLAPYVSTTLGVAVGAGVTWFSFRSRRTSLVQALAVPVGALVGAVLMAPAATGGSANIPSLVVEALKAGGLRQAPVAFDPGWRLICVAVLAGTTAAAISVAASLSRPQLLALVPLPLTAGAAFIQPKGAEVVSAAVAIVFVIGGLSVAYGAALAGDDELGGKFEARRLARGAGLIAAVLVLLVLLAQTDFLFPASDRDQVIPPQKPPPPQHIADRVLFSVESTSTGPWRVGTLDVYQKDAFYLPSVDPKRTRVVPNSGTIRHKAGPTFTATFTLADLPGHQIPVPASPVAVTGAGHQLEYDPRTNLVKVRNTRIPAGMHYTVTAAASPDAKAMAAAPAPPKAIQTEFAAVPPAPPGVQSLLASLPVGISAFDRVQAVRQALYSKVIAAGSGKPVDIKPARVDQLLAGGEATPYEITAAEVLLTRWAGVPARIGFGFSGGETTKGVTRFRPRDGAAWLEAYFNGYGFVPIVGTPPRAKASISPEQKKQDKQVVATDELALTIYVPVRRHDIRAIFEIVRYWLLVVAPILLGATTLIVTAPGIVKELRSRRRRRWGNARSPSARIAVAYAEMRDRAYDLNIGDVRATPLEFLNSVEQDDEHEELAWLVTRALWGDLTRDLQLEDVEAAEDMAASVRRRLSREQTATNRVLGWVSRASLRDPYSVEIPNLWRRRGRRGARRAVAVAAAGALAVSGSCAQPRHEAEPASLRFPQPLMPAKVGDYTLQAEPKLAANYDTVKDKADVMVQDGRVYTLRAGDVIQGSIQVALFKPDANVMHDKGLRRDVEDGLQAGSAVTHHIGLIQVRALTLPEQTMYLWFPPDHNVMELFVMRKSFRDAEAVVDSILEFQRGLPTDVVVEP